MGGWGGGNGKQIMIANGCLLHYSTVMKQKLKIQLRVNNKSLLANSTTATEKEQKSSSEEFPAQAEIVLRSVLTLQEIKDSKQAKTGLRN